MAWLIYDENDSITFVNNKAEELLLGVEFKTELSQVNEVYPIEAEISVADSAGYQWFKIYLLKDGSSFKKYIKCGSVYRDLDNAKTMTDATIAGKQYARLLLIEEEKPEDDDDIAQVIFHQGEGVVQFQLADSTIYTIQR